MKINFQAKNIEITPAIHDYVVKRITNLDKMLSQIESESGEVQVLFSLSKTTHHHKGGEVFHADCSINIKGRKFYSSVNKQDLYEAIDDVKENLFREISKNKDKKISLFHKGARKIKDIVKGINNWRK
ncbi:MAG: ribosome-associated translation inhibitor RaiA [Patescibacteria group bacterium]